MECARKAVAYMGVMGICDGWIRYGRQAREVFLRNSGCESKHHSQSKAANDGRRQAMIARPTLPWFGQSSTGLMSQPGKQKRHLEVLLSVQVARGQCMSKLRQGWNLR
jgi:hypothetical protein